MLEMNHKNCGGKILIDIEVSNIFGKARAKIKDNHKIFLTYSGLIAMNVQVKALGIVCSKCKKLMDNSEEISFRCMHTGNSGIIEDFRIMWSEKPDTGEKLDPIFLHIDAVKNYKNDAENQGFIVSEIQPVIYLDEEIKT